MKVLFFGSSDYCLPILETLHTHFTLVGVVTKPSFPSESFAVSHKIPVFTPGNKAELRTLQNEFIQLQPDIAVVADYGLIIPRDIFTIPKMSTLNIHFSKLPRLRGATPVQFTLLRGGKSAWISVIIMDEAMDTGDIIWQREYPLSGNETTGSLYKKLFNNVASELPDIIYQYAANKLKPQKQNHTEATYTKILTRDDGFIPAPLLRKAIEGEQLTEEQMKQWGLSKYIPAQLCIVHCAFCIECAVRALSPWPGVWTEIAFREISPIHKKRLKILKAHLEPPASQGVTLRGYQDQRLVLDQVQLEGKKPVTWKQFQVGYPHVV